MPITNELIMMLDAYEEDGSGVEPIHDYLIELGCPSIAEYWFTQEYIKRTRTTVVRWIKRDIDRLEFTYRNY